MKKRICALLLAIGLTFGLAGCADMDTTVMTSQEQGEKLSFVADFYDNYGEMWLSVEGSQFNISPNKVKEYYYSDGGTWTYRYAMSSIVSVDIDGKNIESCGSTIIFADSRLTKYEIEIPTEITLSQSDNMASISAPTDLRIGDGWTLDWWWRTKRLENRDIGSKVVIVQSQNGNNICMYVGDKVSWDVPNNLPKTTQLTIDGKPLFIHRANFAIIDMDILQVAE